MSKQLQTALLGSILFYCISIQGIVAQALPAGSYSQYCSQCLLKGTVLTCRCHAHSGQQEVVNGYAQASQLHLYASNTGANTGYAFSASLDTVSAGKRCVSVSATPSGGLSCAQWVTDPKAKSSESEGKGSVKPVKVVGGRVKTHFDAVQNCPFVCSGVNKQWNGTYATDYCGCR